MFLILSGEGPTDIGLKDHQTGPMARFIDQWIEARIDYSLLDCEQYAIYPKQTLEDIAKKMKPRSRRGKKQGAETRFYYKNARALAVIAQQSHQQGAIAILFRDSDGTVSSSRGQWEDKYQSMLNGFAAEQFVNGVPMIPKPKSEAWILCALRHHYQHCAGLENASGNDDSPHSLKAQLEVHLGKPATRELLNHKVDAGECDIAAIVDMPSMMRFKDRLDEVLDSMNVKPR